MLFSPSKIGSIPIFSRRLVDSHADGEHFMHLGRNSLIERKHCSQEELADAARLRTAWSGCPRLEVAPTGTAKDLSR